ncbi:MULTISPECIES: hypothetical protein [unclassified Streptomyces]|nr:hypothetical protein [Streptomyces sp. SceaMP-e96]
MRNTSDRTELDSDRASANSAAEGCNATRVGSARGMDRPSW